MIKQKILVTGSNGQLGRELNELSSSYPQFDFVFLSREELPINHPEAIKKVFATNHPQYCVNCAAYTAVDKAESEKDAAFQINGQAVGVMAAVCKENNCHFIHVSTDYVFDGTASVPYKEDSRTNPQSIYGSSKLEGEKLALQSDPGSIIIRTSWVYSEFGKNFVKTMMRLMSEKEEINVVNDQIGSPTYAADLAKAIMQIIENRAQGTRNRAQEGVFHYSNAGIISWYDFAIAIKEFTGSKCKVNPIPTSQYPTPARRPAYSVLNKTKIQQAFGIELKNWKDSLVVCLEKIEKKL